MKVTFIAITIRAILSSGKSVFIQISGNSATMQNGNFSVKTEYGVTAISFNPERGRFEIDGEEYKNIDNLLYHLQDDDRGSCPKVTYMNMYHNSVASPEDGEITEWKVIKYVPHFQ